MGLSLRGLSALLSRGGFFSRLVMWTQRKKILSVDAFNTQLSHEKACWFPSVLNTLRLFDSPTSRLAGLQGLCGPGTGV